MIRRHHPSTPHRHRVRMEGQKDFGQKNPLSAPNLFAHPPCLDRDDPSSPLFNGLPPPQSVPICESEANLCPSVFQSFTPSPVNARTDIKSGQKNGDKRIRFSCPHSPAVPPPRGNDPGWYRLNGHSHRSPERWSGGFSRFLADHAVCNHLRS